MDAASDLSRLERSIYRNSYSDGVIDLFVGLSLIFIGAIWIWAPDYGGLAGILPAVMAPSLLPLRKQIVEPRGGYVRWSRPRRRWERRNQWAMLLAGILVFILGITVYFVAARASDGADLLLGIGPGLLAFLLAVMAVGLGFMMQVGRMFLYAASLVVGGLLAIMMNASPGWPMLGTGAVVTVTGAVMLLRFLRDNPVVDSPSA